MNFDRSPPGPSLVGRSLAFDPRDPEGWSSAVWQELQRRAAAHEPLGADEFLDRLAGRDDCEEQAVDVIYAEFTLRRERGEAVSHEEYLEKYPRYARLLARQFAVESGLDSLHLAKDDTLLDWALKRGDSEARDSAVESDDGAKLRTIGRYIVVDELASTPKSQVFRVVHPELRRECVLKLATSPKLTDERRWRATREGRLLAELDHPHVARVLDSDIIDGRPYIVCEYVRGRSLGQFVRESQSSPNSAARLIATVARAVGAVHRAGLLHLDVKPANILVRESGEPCLIDFDLAASRDDLGGAEMETGSLRGTLQFMAPEQAVGASAEVDQRADVFALGAVLFFALTGRPPYDADAFPVLLAKVREGAWNRELLSGASIPRGLAKVCERAMADDPAERYSQAEEFANAIDSQLTRVESRRTALAAGVFAATATLLAAAIAFVYLSTTRAAPVLGRIPAELSVHVFDGSRFLDLEDVTPIETGTPINFQMRRPAGVSLLLVLIDSSGEVHELLRDDVPGEATSVHFPGPPPRAAPLTGPPGTEIVLLLGRSGQGVSFNEVKRACGAKEPWPPTPNDSVVRTTASGVVAYGGTRALGEPTTVETPLGALELRLTKLVEALQPQCNVIEAVAFPHSAAPGE